MQQALMWGKWTYIKNCAPSPNYGCCWDHERVILIHSVKLIFYFCKLTGVQIDWSTKKTTKPMALNYPIIKKSWCLFVVCLCGSLTRKLPDPISMKSFTTTAHIPGSDVSLFSFRYRSPFQNGGSFSDVITCQIRKFYNSL